MGERRLSASTSRERLPPAAKLGVAVMMMRPPADTLAALGVRTWAEALLEWAFRE
jgi:hypothetical protein